MIGLGTGLGFRIKASSIGNGGGGGEPSLSNDTSLGTFTIDGTPVVHSDTIQRPNTTTAVDVIAIPTHPSATRQINGDSGVDPISVALNVGDNAVTVAVTAENAVSTENHIVTVRRLTAGLQEITTINSVTNAFNTGGAGEGFIISNASDRIGFWGSLDGVEQPDWSAYGVTSYVAVIGISGESSEGDCAMAFKGALEANGFSVTTNSPGITITDNSVGSREDAVVSNGLVAASVTISVFQQGENPS